MNTVIKRAWNKNKLVKVEDLTGMTFQAESGGHTFEISGVDDTGAAVSLSGTVEGRFLRADNAEIIISGAASGGKASVTLSDVCYAIPGRFLLTIYVTSDGQKVAVYAATGSVVATSGTASGSIPPLVTDSVQANTGSFGSISTGDATVDGVLDVTQRRCYANLSSAGWYRALNVTGGFGGGVRSFAVDINITRSYDSTNNEAHCVKLLCVYNGNSIFTNEVSKSNALIIDKIRYNNDSGGNGYLDIHYSGSVANETSVDFTVHVNPQSQNRFTVRPLDPVADSPSGETVLTEYTFATNTEGTISTPYTGVSGSHIIDSNCRRSGKVVSYHLSISSLTSSEIAVTNGAVLASGLVPPDYMVITLGQYWVDTSKANLRCRVTTAGNLEVFWDSGAIPKSGQSIIFEITYIAA